MCMCTHYTELTNNFFQGLKQVLYFSVGVYFLILCLQYQCLSPSFQKWDSIAAPKPISNEYFPTLIMFVRRSIEENQANISIHNVSFQFSTIRDSLVLIFCQEKRQMTEYDDFIRFRCKTVLIIKTFVVVSKLCNIQPHFDTTISYSFRV